MEGKRVISIIGKKFFPLLLGPFCSNLQSLFWPFFLGFQISFLCFNTSIESVSFIVGLCNCFLRLEYIKHKHKAIPSVGVPLHFGEAAEHLSLLTCLVSLVGCGGSTSNCGIEKGQILLTPGH
jgi:hypothetical protein